MIRVIAYTGGHNAPSRVPRVQQYITPLKALGVDMLECPSRVGLYPPRELWRRPFWGLQNLAERLPDVLRSRRYDLSFFQREMLSTMVTWEPFAKRPRVFDVDDAIWINRGGRFARRLAKLCDHVICGNCFLAEEFSKWNPRVSILPTPVDTLKFYPCPVSSDPERTIIGWMGLSSGFKFLYGIEPALRQVLRLHPGATLRIISNEPPRFQELPQGQVEFIRWTREEQVRLIQEMTIGIMPLDNSIESQGKCSFKMLLYMACGLPVVVSPIGMNAEVLRKGEVGFGASSLEEWVSALDDLIRDAEKRLGMGKIARKIIKDHYSVDILAPQLAATLHAVIGTAALPAKLLPNAGQNFTQESSSQPVSSPR